MKFLSVVLLVFATAQLSTAACQRGYVNEPCQTCQQPSPCGQSFPQPLPLQQPYPHHMYVVEDPTREVVLLEEPCRELIVIDTSDEPSALERILRILRKTGLAVRRVGDILAHDSGDELGLEDYGSGSASAVAHTIINLGHPYVPFPEDIQVIEPVCEETVVVQAPQVIDMPAPSVVYQQVYEQVPVYQQPCEQVAVYQQPRNQVPVVQQPCNQVPFVQQPCNQVPAVQQPCNQVQYVQQPQVLVAQPQPVQPVFFEDRYPCEDEYAIYQQPYPAPNKYTYNRY